MKGVGSLGLFLLVLFSSALVLAKRDDDRVQAQDGRINLRNGRLGKVPPVQGHSEEAWVSAVTQYLEKPSTRKRMGITSPRNDAEQLRAGDRKVLIFDSDDDEVHVYLQGFLHNLKVYGGEVEVHLHENSRVVYSLSGNRLLVSEVKASGEGHKAKISGADAVKRLLKKVKARGEKKVSLQKKAPADGELCYIFDSQDKGRLAYRILVKYESSKGPQRSDFFVSAHTGKIITERPEIALAQNRLTYDKQGATHYGTGKLILTEKDSLSKTRDEDVKQAHVHTASCYKFFKDFFNRDSINGKGMALKSNVHQGRNYNNAFWYRNMLFYGDGDGRRFKWFARDITVVCHEFAHGVTQYCAGLVYQGESGALNEATSDIFGATARMYAEKNKSWKIGDKCRRPVGNSLRYMSDPAKDRSSRDYYPHRYQGGADKGGVHWNSGIANLFFVKLSDGGSHPRGKNKLNAHGIGWNKAVKIWYRALDRYFPNRCTFAQARLHTITAATDIHGKNSREAHSVKEAWHVVGVGPNPGPYKGKPPPKPRTECNKDFPDLCRLCKGKVCGAWTWKNNICIRQEFICTNYKDKEKCDCATWTPKCLKFYPK